jgi:hypothetical protein
MQKVITYGIAWYHRYQFLFDDGLQVLAVATSYPLKVTIVPTTLLRQSIIETSKVY